MKFGLFVMSILLLGAVAFAYCGEFGSCTACHNCGSCANTPGCGWCASTNSCISGTGEGPLNASACEAESWKYSTVSCATPTITPTPITKCNSNLDCVPASCCHATSCVLQTQAPSCSDTACTLECRGRTLDCGGSCSCVNHTCSANFGDVGTLPTVSSTPTATPTSTMTPTPTATPVPTAGCLPALGMFLLLGAAFVVRK